MDKELKALKQSLDQTALRNLDFKEKNKQAVRTAILEQQKETHRQKTFIPKLKYIFSIAASFLILIGALYFAMHSTTDQQTQKSASNTQNHSIALAKTQEYTILFRNGVTSNDIKSKMIDHYNFAIKSFTHDVKAADGQIYKNSYIVPKNEYFGGAVTKDQNQLEAKIQNDIKTIEQKVTAIKNMMADPKTKGRGGVNQANIDQLTNAVKARQSLLKQVKSQPLTIISMTVTSTPTEVKKIKALSMVANVIKAKSAPQSTKQNSIPNKNVNQSESIPTVKDHVTKVDMINQQIGWGASTNDIIKTTDGGVHWNLVAIPGLRQEKITSSTFFSENIAMIFALTPNNQVVLHKTTDGGHSWVTVTTPLLPTMNSEFISEQLGWVQCQSTNHTNILYKTTDGGKTWTKVSSDNTFENPANGVNTGLSFSDQLNGWLTGAYNSPTKPWFYQTNNGGKTWFDKQLPSVKGLKSPETKPLKIFNGGTAILPIEGWQPPAQSSTIVFYKTTDNGKTWGAGTLLKPQGMTIAYDFINGNTGWVLDYKNIYTTHDGGKTWSKSAYKMINVSIPQSSFVILELEMSTQKEGVMLIQNTENEGVTILTTNDSGKSWTTADNSNVMNQIAND